MAQMSLHEELLNQQQETINSFIKSLVEEISQNSQQVQGLMAKQISSSLPKSILGQVWALIEKRSTNASKLKVLKELNREAMEIAEEQHHRLKASEPENYGGARPKTTSGTKLTSVAPSVLPQEVVAPIYNSSLSKLRQEQQIEDHAVLLRDEIFSVIPGTVNTQHSTALYNRIVKSGIDFSDDEVFHLPQVPDMVIAGSSHGHKVTFRSPVVRPGSVSLTPHLVSQPVSLNMSRIPNIETSVKDTDSETEVFPRTPHQKVKRMRNDVSITYCSLQLVAEEFRKICKTEI